MAYAEKHGRGWRARWRDPDGGLRSASGFASRKAAETYGRDREAGYRFYSFTRAQLIDAIAGLEVRPALLPGRDRPVILAESMADAIIEALDDATERLTT